MSKAVETEVSEEVENETDVPASHLFCKICNGFEWDEPSISQAYCGTIAPCNGRSNQRYGPPPNICAPCLDNYRGCGH